METVPRWKQPACHACKERARDGRISALGDLIEPGTVSIADRLRRPLTSTTPRRPSALLDCELFVHTMERHEEPWVGERNTPRRAVILARHRAINTSRWVAQQGQRDRCAIIRARPNQEYGPRPPFTAAHSTARPSLLAPHTHPSQSLSFAARHHTRFCFVVCPSTLPFY